MEINTGATKDISAEVARVQERCMIEAGDLFLSELSLRIDTNIGECWIH